MNKLITIYLVLILAGCSAVGVVPAHDPYHKIEQAERFLDKQTPLPAEQLILDAIEVLMARGDDEGLMRAYMAYARFFQSTALASRDRQLQEGDLNKRLVLYDNHHTKACRYYREALAYYERFRTERPDAPMVLPAGFDSFPEYVHAYQDEIECE